MNSIHEIRKQVKRLEFVTRRKMNSIFQGRYHSAFKGQGMTFSEFREYVPGDDVRAISWTLTARAGRPYIKKFDEERELSMLLLVDFSGSMAFGTSSRLKKDVATELSALIAFVAARSNDLVGLIAFSSDVHSAVPVRKGMGHVMRLLHVLVRPIGFGVRTSLEPAVRAVSGLVKKRSIIFVISDFMETDDLGTLAALRRKHDVVGVQVVDAAEQMPPKLGLTVVEDAESGEIFEVDFSSAAVRSEFERAALERDRLLRDRFKAMGIPLVQVQTEGDFVQPLALYFKKRSGMASGGTV